MDMNGLDESIFLTVFPVDKNKPVKSYIVCWVLREIEEGVGGKGDIITDTDHYSSFIDGTSKENEEAANKLYNKLIAADAYSVNICEVINSTDY